MKPVIPRHLARRDIDEAVAYYLREATPEVALNFVDALERACRHISRHPSSGSPRYAHELDLPGLRAWPLNGFPHIVFFVERADHVDVWRVLHGHRDIPGWMQEPNGK